MSQVQQTPPNSSFWRRVNYCLIAKVASGIPALIIAANLMAMQFHGEIAKLCAAAATVFMLVFLSVKIERMPALSRMIVKKD